MKRLTQYWHSVKKVPTKYWIFGALALMVVWFFFLRSDAKGEETLTVAQKDLVATVSVAGSVVAAQEVDLGFTQSGRITAVYARVGEHVGAGATLAVIDNGDLRAALLQRQAALENQRARLAALQAGTRPEEIAVAQSTVDNDIRGLIDDLQDGYRAADSAVHNTLDQFISNPRTSPVITFSTSDSNIKTSVESKRLTAEAMLSAWGSEVAALSASSDLSAATQRAQRNLASVALLLSEANAALNRAVSNGAVSQSSLDTYSANVAAARTTVNAAVSAITSGSGALEADMRTLALKKAGATAEDVAAKQAEVKAAEADVAAAQAQLNKTVLSAPFSGTITTVDAKVGKIVSPNTSEVSMISSGTFQIESYIPEIALSALAVGQPAVVHLDAYGLDEAFSAKVITIAPASEVRDGVPTYKTVLQFSKADPRIRSGMTADLSIVTQEKKSVIALPQGAVVRRDGKAFVTVQVGKQKVEREVMTGISSIGEVEIVSGLSVGDTVVLTPAS